MPTRRLWPMAALSLVLPVLLATPSTAAPQQASFEQVSSQLGVAQEPTDFVVLVDTSASMTDRGRYGQVHSGLEQMLASLPPEDRVTLVTFDSQPQVRSSFTPVGQDPEEVLASLPAQPTGDATDIGAAVAAGLDVLERPEMRSRGALLLFTDGLIDTEDDSAYATTTLPAWDDLQRRAAAVQAEHDIAPLAIALQANTDAAVLKEVFTDVTDVPAAQLGEYLSQVSTDVMEAAVTKQLQDQIDRPVRASLPDEIRTTSDGRPTTVALTVENTSETIPVQVSALTVTTDPAIDLQVTGIPETLDLAAGESTTIDLELASTLPAGTASAVTLGGTVESPWQQVITQDLALTWTGVLETQPTTITSTESMSERLAGLATSPYARQLGIALLAMLVAVLAWAAWLASRPRLAGSLTVHREGHVVDERVLKGRAMSVKLPDSGVSVQLRPAKIDDAERGLGITVAGSQEPATATLRDGEGLAVGDLTFTYTTDRTRMLQLIGQN